MRRRQFESGFTLLELLVAMGISVIVIGSVLQQYSATTGLSHDHGIRVSTLLEAQALLQAIGAEVRMIGNGVPFDQANFQIGEDTLSNPSVSEPIAVATTTANLLEFRLNETGDVALLTADFDPSTSLSLTLTESASLQSGDPIYITNSSVSGEDGLYGVVASVNSGSNTATLEAGFVASPAAVFPTGSILEEVPLVRYASSGNLITRDSGFGPVVMSNRASVTFEFLRADGTVIPLPLTNLLVVSDLRAIRVQVTQTSSKNLKDGSPYTVTAEQVFGIRNLNYLF